MSGSLNLIDHTSEQLAYLSEKSLRINYCAQNAGRFLICSIYDASADECSLSGAAAIRKTRLCRDDQIR